MANYVYFKGKGSWCRHLFQLDDSFAAPGDPGYWHVTLHPDQDSINRFNELKLKNVLKTDDDGLYFKPRRPRKKIIRLKNGATKELIFDAPKVFDKEGVPLSSDARIGNGSDLTVKCELYTYGHAGSRHNAIRLESVRVDNLVPYVPPNDYINDERLAAEGLMDQPEPMF